MNLILNLFPVCKYIANLRKFFWKAAASSLLAKMASIPHRAKSVITDKPVRRRQAYFSKLSEQNIDFPDMLFLPAGFG
jgi:hypothetical protein